MVNRTLHQENLSSKHLTVTLRCLSLREWRQQALDKASGQDNV